MIVDKNPDDWGIGKSKTGWMTGPLFYEYIANIFYKWLIRKGTEFPVVLYVDGHSSHMTMELSNFCKEKQIELIVLFPNATHLMQPLDTSYFEPLKTAWKNAVLSWRMANNGRAITCADFAGILHNVLKNQNNQTIACNGFRSCGLYPFDFTALNTDRILLKSGSSFSSLQLY